MIKSKMKARRGYTLIELLVVMIVMVTIGNIVVTILVSSLRGTNKTNVINAVRENGNYAILQMSKMIEFAQNFSGVSLNGISYTSDCLQTPSPLYNYIKITSFDNAQTIFSCKGPGIFPTIASNGADLINTSDVRLTSCYFTCRRSGISQLPTIGINFTLSQKTASVFFEKTASISFETSVLMRNLNK